ncbi:bifunctional riboflavin kinase/FAD synthetase [Candidatus Riesia pediculischaeffi]|uniref:Riboflavin biosynthesis protein n=2 Tax=Candidatus Riesia pediculischaeffi TaxID=428411 RepID=A0A1V0HJX1_9ENTR|nr:bifunctional riboflavin kinase/FAD synthetase [Candidatus Riesia pediculischaeffi]ARC53134.1 FMN adenylyltransferase [Candidatus Riesia pediculischaeffi]KIE64246.1 Riboflavin kinase / FMN adenylyltransferase [Candidatus Riesia pediculischaeffi PTSU]
MKLIRGIHNIRNQHYGCSLTIGNFDSVHIGHQMILKKLIQCKHPGSPTIVMIFEPQPLEFFLGELAPARLTGLRDKIKYISEYEIDYLLCVNFNRSFSCLTHRDFIDNLLIKRLGIRLLIIGDDFQFGKNRLGTFKHLFQAGRRYGFHVFKMKSFFKYGVRVSSTSVRKALLQDDLSLAKNLMGRPYQLSGKIVHGNKFGSIIGFPTANLLFRYFSIAIKGVYVAEVQGLLDNAIKSVVNVGIRPTVEGRKRQIEVHLIDTKMNMYGSYINIVIHKKLREEIRFSSIFELTRQIHKDIDQAKIFFDSFYFGRNI